MCWLHRGICLSLCLQIKSMIDMEDAASAEHSKRRARRQGLSQEAFKAVRVEPIPFLSMQCYVYTQSRLKERFCESVAPCFLGIASGWGLMLGLEGPLPYKFRLI